MKDNQALIVVDVQKDFLETGALPVKEGSQVVPVINRIIPKFKNVVFTQDWHPQGHISFASSHPDTRTITVVLDYTCSAGPLGTFQDTFTLPASK